MATCVQRSALMLRCVPVSADVAVRPGHRDRPRAKTLAGWPGHNRISRYLRSVLFNTIRYS
jgi:hypothetical protein